MYKCRILPQFCQLSHSFAASQDLNAENSSLGDILEESDWDVNSDVAMATEGRGGALMKRSLQAEKEIRYVTKVIIYFKWSTGCVLFQVFC